MNQTLIAAALAAGVVVTGIALVSTAHESRRLFQERESLRAEQDRLQEDWSALRIEASTLEAHARIDTIAREVLGLVDPMDDEVYVEILP